MTNKLWLQHKDDGGLGRGVGVGEGDNNVRYYQPLKWLMSLTLDYDTKWISQISIHSSADMQNPAWALFDVCWCIAYYLKT